MSSLFKVIRPGGDDGFEVVDTAGAVTVKIDGTRVLAEQQVAIASLAQDISAAYVEAEVQAISTKVDAILAMLRTHGLIAT